mgnify:CR=1 FL=1|tara:strand:+ start:1335 stop:1910 length:576 start_codon:yes stop_codon:yes gene_type:complete
MVATVNIFTDFGGSDGNPSNEQNISSNSPVNLRFKTADNNTVDSVDEIKIPETGTNRSYWKHVYLKVTGGTFSRINNIKFYTAGTNFGTGITVNVGNETPIKNSGYIVANGIRGTTGDEMITNHGGISAKTEVFGNYISATPKSISISESGGNLDSVGETSDYLVFQMDVGSTATKADLSNKTWTFQYDEV